MPAQTPHGFPYPLPDEPVAEGAAAIRSLAEAIDAKAAVRIAEVALAADAPSIDFAGIPATFRHLELVAAIKLTQPAVLVTVTLRVNGDASPNYFAQRMRANGANVEGIESINVPGFPIDALGADAPSLAWAPLTLSLPTYRDAGLQRLALWESGALAAGSAGGLFRASGFGIYGAAAAVDRLTLLEPSGWPILAGSRATLYGLP
jgi:hypothetical protein